MGPTITRCKPSPGLEPGFWGRDLPPRAASSPARAQEVPPGNTLPPLGCDRWREGDTFQELPGPLRLSPRQPLPFASAHLDFAARVLINAEGRKISGGPARGRDERHLPYGHTSQEPLPARVRVRVTSAVPSVSLRRSLGNDQEAVGSASLGFRGTEPSEGAHFLSERARRSSSSLLLLFSDFKSLGTCGCKRSFRIYIKTLPCR